MTTPKTSYWVLTPDYALSFNALNWILSRKVYSKKGKPTTWKIIGYFSTLSSLAVGLQNTILLTETDAPTFQLHLNIAVATAQDAITALNAQMITLGIGLTTKPPGYAKFDQEK